MPVDSIEYRRIVDKLVSGTEAAKLTRDQLCVICTAHGLSYHTGGQENGWLRKDEILQLLKRKGVLGGAAENQALSAGLEGATRLLTISNLSNLLISHRN